MPTRFKHHIVVDILFDRPVTEDEAVRLVRKPLTDQGTQPASAIGRSFSIQAVKSFTRLSAAPNRKE